MLLFSVALLFLLIPSLSLAGAPVHGSKAAAMGTAFVAIADDPSAITHNPAGITQLKGTNIYGGTTFVIPSTTFESPSGQSEETDFQVFFPPHLYLVSDLGKKNMRFGIGIYSPFGIGGRKWDEKGLTKYSSVKNMIATLSVNPTFAYQILPTLSVGVGVSYMLSRTEAEKMVNQSMLGAGDSKLKLEGIGGGWGYNFGLLFIPHEKVRMGLAYRSRIKVTHEGDIEFERIAPALQPAFGGSSFETDIDAPTTFPDLLNFGIAFMPDEKWTVAIEFEYGGWSSFDNAELKLEHEIPEAGFTDSSIPLDWNDAWIAKIGAEYKVNDKLSVRGGYAYVETMVPEHTLDAGNPDSDNHNFCIGFGYKVKSFVLDLFYIADIYEDRSVRNNILSGEYKNFAHFLGFSIGKKF